jgi:tetratricopeptide (TPR) repeat protein
VQGGSKEKKMKRTLTLWLSLVALALVPVLAQEPAKPTGKIHGTVTNPTGAPQQGGVIALVATTRAASGPGLKEQTAEVATLPVDQNGQFTGTVPVGIYRVNYRSPGMPNDKEADHVEKVEVKVDATAEVNIDMSRKEYIEQLPADQKRQLEEMREKNKAAMAVNAVIKNLNADLKLTEQDLKEADGAHAAAVAALGAGASKTDIDAKEAEIKKAKFEEVETIMLKDTGAKPDASVLWARLGQAQVGLKKYDEAEVTFKKALELETSGKKTNPAIEGLAQSELGEIFARTGKVEEANAAYDAAAKLFPTQAGFYFRNEAIIFSQVGNATAQLAAAEKAIAIDPKAAVPYYLKGQALVGQTTVDEKTHKLVPPEGCAEAYQKYLELDPNGPYSAEVKGVLAGFNQVISSGFKAEPDKKKKK